MLWVRYDCKRTDKLFQILPQAPHLVQRMEQIGRKLIVTDVDVVIQLELDVEEG